VRRIDSSKNPELRERAKLKERRARTREGRFLIEGAREVQRALAAGVKLEALYLCEAFLGDAGREVVAEAERRGAPLTELSEAAFAGLSYRENPDGVIAVAERLARTLTDLVLPADALVVVVEGLEKPGNLGALLRTADSVGAHALFATGGGTDLENPNVIRASMGSLFSRPVLEVGGAELLSWLEREGFSLVATTPHTDTLYWDAAYTGRTAVLLGAEHEGLSQALLDAADIRVKIPMQGLADSLNVATTGALILYEALRQRRRPQLAVGGTP
jgi:RNA methyltransferase, TrmH family